MAKRSRKRKAAESRIPAKFVATSDQVAASWFKRDWFLGPILVVAVILAYQPVWYAGFVWDDDHHVTPMDLRSWGGLARIWFDVGATQQYYPLVHSIFWAEHGIWGDEPLGYHLVNVLLY